MQKRIRPDSTAALTLIATAAAVALLHVFRPILWPFALALVLAILIQAFIRAVSALCPWADRRAILVLSGAAVIGLGFAATLVILPGVSQAAAALPRVQARIDGLLLALSARTGLEEPLSLAALLGGLDLRTAAAFTLRNVGNAASGLILTALFLIFLLFGWDTIRRRIDIATGSRGARSTGVLQRSIRGVEAYLWIQTLSGLINAIAAAMIMFAVGLDHWHFWAVALFALAYIPFLGVAVGSFGPALFALLQFPTATEALLIFGVIQATAFLTGNLLVPRMQATSQNIDPCASLLAVGGWSLIWGLPGAFLAVPLTLALIYYFAGTPRLRWLAVLLSNDGDPSG